MSAGREITLAPAENAPADDANTTTTGLSSRAGAPVGATIDRARQPVYGQGIVVSLIAAAFLLILAILAVRERQTVTGTPATETTGPLFWGLAVLFTVLIAVGAQFSEISAGRSAAALGHPRRKRDYPTAWIIPTAGMFAAILLVATLHSTLCSFRTGDRVLRRWWFSCWRAIARRCHHSTLRTRPRCTPS